MEDDEDATFNSDGDETITLNEIVAGRNITLREEELWALCRECCLTLEFVHSTQELFQSLVITPETVAFDRDGNVCFLDLDADPESLYIPPEYEEDKCSYKSHLFSLGMTLLFAMEYSNITDHVDSDPSLSQDIRDLLTHLTQDDPENRPDLELVLEYCERALQETSSQDVCQRFACVSSEEQHPKEEGASLLSMTEELAAYLHNQNGLVTPAMQHSNTTSDSESSKQLSCSKLQALDAQIQTGLPGKTVHDLKPDRGSFDTKSTVKSGKGSPSIEHNSHMSAGDDSSLVSPRKNRRRQGLLLSDVLAALDRNLQESELWALCRECIVSLQRKRKHLPAYISLDTVMIREVGNVSFKAIPEDKPLEVIYMAPELQQKGILNEKTCVYGLGVTLRCAAGHKYDYADIDDKLGPAFRELLTTLLEENPDLRPSLEVCLMACDEFEKQSSIDSRLLCQEVYMDACALTSNREAKKSDILLADSEETSFTTATELQTSWTELEDAEKEGSFLEDMQAEEGQLVEPPAQAFQPVTTAIQSTFSGSAFKPVPFKPKPGKREDSGDEHSQRPFPGAFTSPATHFKPIVVTQADNSGEGNSVSQGEDREKNVVQKLREIKKNLLKHRSQGSLSSDVEVDDSKPPISEKSRTPRNNTSGRNSTKSSGSGEVGGVLENLLQQMQSSGQMPDTQNLALAIAQHLQAKMGSEFEGQAVRLPQVSGNETSQSYSIKTSHPSVFTPQGLTAETDTQNSALQRSQTEPPGHPSGPLPQIPGIPGSLPLPQFAGQMAGRNLGGMNHSGYMGQPMSMPVVPFASGVMPGSVPCHLQQDPHTGLFHLVPVPVMSYGHQAGAPRSPHTPSSDRGYNLWQQAVTVSPDTAFTPNAALDNEGSVHQHSVRSNVSSRNARGLIQKTANQRAKNSACTSPGYMSDSGAGFTHSQAEDDSVHHSGCVLKKEGSFHKRSRSSGGLEPSDMSHILDSQGDYGDRKFDDSLILEDKNRSQGVPVYKPPNVLQSGSPLSSPSPSKDSGICLTQGAAASQVSSVNLMERLLNSDNFRHQQTVTQVLHILNQSFRDQGPDSFPREEKMAEYVVSLAHLKWETFMRAVTEKYPRLFWSHTVLINLYDAVNKQSSVHPKSSGKNQSKKDAKHLGSGKRDSQTAEGYRMQTEPVSAGSGRGQGGVSMDTRLHDSDMGKHQRAKANLISPSAGRDSGEQQSMVRVLANGRYISETSDSTDNEQEDKRRRFKKRYELDRNKSSSLHSLPGSAVLSVAHEQRAREGLQGEGHGHHRQLGHHDLTQAHSVHDVSVVRPSANSRELDLHNSGHNLPQPSSLSRSHHSQHPRPESRDVASPSQSNTSHVGASAHSPPGAGKDFHSFPSRSRRSHSGAISQSESPYQHFHSPANITDSPKVQRPDSRDSQRALREFPGLNTGGSPHSPAFSEMSKEHNTDVSYPEPKSSVSSSAAHSQGFVYGQLREPLGKPPSCTSPPVTRSLRNTHSPHSNSKSEANSLPLPNLSSHGSDASLRQGRVDTKSRASKGSSQSSPHKTQHRVRPQLVWDQEIAEYRKKGQVVYHSAMIQLSMTSELDRFIHAIDESNKDSVSSKLSSVQQEISMLRRQRRKSQAFYKRLTDPAVKQSKGENNKSVIGQVLKDMSEMTTKLRYLDLCRTHLQMLLAEQGGLDTCYITALANCGGMGREEEVLVLQPYLENQLLQFQTVRETTMGGEVQVLQAGHPQGLLAFLFTVSSLSDGYIHQFLFCFRYFLQAEEVFDFITQKYNSAKRGNQSDGNIVRTQQRALDLLQYWVEGYYSLDFERNGPLLDRLEAFIMQRVEEKVEVAQNLMNLLYACHLGENSELIRQADDTEDLDEVYYLHLAAPKRQTGDEQLMEWESFRSLIGRRKSDKFFNGSGKSGQAEKGGVTMQKKPASNSDDGSTTSLSRRTDVTQLMDYAPHKLAEQLTLMEQELFQRTHPVHYLDSKCQGVGVDLSMPSLRTPSMTRKAKPESQSLFAGKVLFEQRISELIAHSQEISHWVSAEVLCCGSQKSQVAALSKFLQTAQLCMDIKNYSTALAITAGLDNLLVRQLPAWKHLPAKTATFMDDLEALQVKIKGEPMALMQMKDSHKYPTIPCTLFFVLHLQQLEIGGFTLANGMFKWQKMRSICQMIDQIRIFREYEYGFEPDYELQSLVRRRLHELSDRDLHSVAAANDNNFRRVVSHAAGLQGTWRKVKIKLQSRTR